jgi:hypothetical protein
MPTNSPSTGIELIRLAEAQRARELLVKVLPELELATVTLGRAGEDDAQRNVVELSQELRRLVDRLPNR